MNDMQKINSIINSLENAVRSDSLVSAIDELEREIAKQNMDDKESTTKALILGYVINLKSVRAGAGGKA